MNPDQFSSKPNQFEALFTSVYFELRSIAAWHISSSGNKITLDPTDLVHDAVSRMLNQRENQWNNSTHLLALTSIMIRRVFLNHIRSRNATIRGGGTRPRSLNQDPAHAGTCSDFDFLAMNEALDRLECISERQARIVEMKFFGGLTTHDMAMYLQVSERTVHMDWNHAKHWLARELANG